MAGLVPFNKKKSELINTGITDFTNMLDDFFTDNWPFVRSLAGDTFKIDVQDNGKEYVVEAELPGFDKKDVDVTIDDGRLKISAKKEESKDESGKNYIHKERRYSSMVRHIVLADCDCTGMKAKMESGVLTVTVPKIAKPDKSLKIDIE